MGAEGGVEGALKEEVCHVFFGTKDKQLVGVNKSQKAGVGVALTNKRVVSGRTISGKVGWE